MDRATLKYGTRVKVTIPSPFYKGEVGTVIGAIPTTDWLNVKMDIDGTRLALTADEFEEAA